MSDLLERLDEELEQLRRLLTWGHEPPTARTITLHSEAAARIRALEAEVADAHLQHDGADAATAIYVNRLDRLRGSMTSLVEQLKEYRRFSLNEVEAAKVERTMACYRETREAEVATLNVCIGELERLIHAD